MTVKIADFGLSLELYESDYYTLEDRSQPLPIKWMAVESFTSTIFSRETDVVSLSLANLYSYGEYLYSKVM